MSKIDKEQILRQLKTCEDRVEDLEKSVALGKKLTPFGLWILSEDKKFIAKYEVE